MVDHVHAHDALQGDHLGTLVRRPRRARGPTLRDLGHLCGYSDSTLSRLETGRLGRVAGLGRRDRRRAGAGPLTPRSAFVGVAQGERAGAAALPGWLLAAARIVIR
ncbi:helix-turn-helix domain-containing protein [Actinokineospora globicatena]|uniref:helix-turn-helix domain-containing protein n=1 Tax=Actinokineospora globicatena TaxID=103729 RepID=UPI0020A46CAE|nr:helix-turn-helix transcriptional regulator [Actinokineospora globicatena]